MKPICERCPLTNKSIEACQRRGCKEAEPLPPAPPAPPVPQPLQVFPMSEGELLDMSDAKLLIKSLNYYDGSFVGCVKSLDDSSHEHGHFGSYVTKGRYYKFTMISLNMTGEHASAIWEVSEEGTERFHREGSTGAQFLLYWFKDSGFSFDLDS